MSTPHKYVKTIICWASGGEIQVKYLEDETPVFMDYVLKDMPDFDYTGCEWRIKPKTVKLRYRVALMKENGFYIAASEEGGIVSEKHSCFVKWLTEWIEIEV
jgi:hypothetical protein